VAPEDNLSPLVSFDELSPLAREVSQDQKNFDQNIFAQEGKITVLRDRWKYLGPREQNLLLQQWALLFPRSREDDNPQECLKQILQLPTPEDVQRALRVKPKKKPYQTDPGEEIYPATGWLGDYLEYAKWNEVPLAHHFWAGVSILGAAVRRNFYLDDNIEYLWMNQFIILGGSRGTGKSAALGIAMDILARVNRQLDDMEKDKETKNASAFQIPFIPSDITPPDLKTQLHRASTMPRHIKVGGQSEQHPGEAVAILFSDELANLLGKGKFGADQMIPLLCELCFKGGYTSSTKTGGLEKIERMAFSILGCTQPGWMRNTITQETKEGGFTDRVNIIHRPESSRVYSRLDIPPIDPLKAETLASQLRDFTTRTGNPQVLRMSEEAHRFHNEWYSREKKKGPTDSVDAYFHTLRRMCIHKFRLGALLAISEGKTLPFIQKSHLQEALIFLEAEKKYLPDFMADANETKEGRVQKEMVAWIGSQGGLVKKGAFGQWAGRKWPDIYAPERDRIAENLESIGRIIIYTKPGVTYYGLPDGPQP